MKTLIVEDDFTSRLLLQEILLEFGPCHVAVNGQEAVNAAIEAKKQKDPYDLICMDIQMPGMDGQEALRQIRSFENKTANHHMTWTKIIMITSVNDVKQVIEAYGNLCDEYLSKPINIETLLKTLRKLMLIPA